MDNYDVITVSHLMCFQVPASCASCVRGLPRGDVSQANLWHFQPCHAEAGAISQTLC